MKRRVTALPMVLCIVLLALGQQAPAAADSSPQEVNFAQTPSDRFAIWRGYGEQVNAILTLPSNAAGKVPAVVMIHTRGGYNPTQYDFYGAALREKGIATLGLVLFHSGPRHQPSDLIPHAFGALKYLASRPDIDSNRIGIMGFSMGGILTVLTASEMLASEHMVNGPRFAAHVAFYPVCWIHEEIVRNTPRMKRAPDAYARLTGSPVHILAGGKDQWDDPDSCQKFLEALAPEARKSVSLTYFPDATHHWDPGTGSGPYFGAAACKGRGCYVEDRYDSVTAENGKRVALEFFTSILLRGQRK